MLFNLGWIKAHGYFFVLLLVSVSVRANITAQATRLVYHSDVSEANFRLENNFDKPALFQAWIDDGDTIKTPGKLKVPFVVTPPLARIEANNSQTLRIFYIGEHQLPGDKESVFWLNILDIPPKPSADDQTKQYVQLAARSRFKLFYRPSGLVGNAHDAPTKMQWRLIKQLGKNSLISYNPTPFYVSLNRVNLVRSDGRLIKVTPNMLAPHDTVTLSVDESINVGSNVKVRYEAIGDLGEIIKGEIPLIN